MSSKLDTNEIILPRRDENGHYRISYSQYDSWKAVSSFNLKVYGNIEYMAAYFFGDKFPDAGWAQFGHEVEGYVTERDFADKFTAKEKQTMDPIVPLGVFQHEMKLYLLPNVYLLGYIDDMTSDMSKIRDYKTCSANSKAKYNKPDYYQLDIYGMYVQQVTGRIPEAEVCAIERKGNVMGKVNARHLLSVGESVWYIPKEFSQERFDIVKADLLKFVYSLSEHYKLYLKLNGQGL